MTPAERARQIDKEEFAAECAAVRQRAFAAVAARRSAQNVQHALRLETAKPVRTRYSAEQKVEIGEWANKLGLSQQAFKLRVRKTGWEAAIALGKNVRRSRSAQQ